MPDKKKKPWNAAEEAFLKTWPEFLCCSVNPYGTIYGRRICKDHYIEAYKDYSHRFDQWDVARVIYESR